MNDKPTVVQLPPKNEMKAATEMLRRVVPELVENARLIAQVRRASYLAHIAEGFTEAQALELCKTSTL